MPHKQPNLERQLSNAQQLLDVRNAELNEQGVVEKKRRKDPSWRQLNAQRLKLKSRLRAATAVVELTEEVIRRKAEKPLKSKADDGKKAGKKSGKKAERGEKGKKGDKKQKKDGKKAGGGNKKK